jgi:hypothetical protein
MRYTVTITGQIDTPHGSAEIVRDAGWILTQAVSAVVPGTVQVTSVEPVEPVANPAVDAAESAIRALSLADQQELAWRFGVDL